MRCPITELECSRQFCVEKPNQPECRIAAVDLSILMTQLLLEVTDGKITIEEGRAKFQQELSNRAGALELTTENLRAETEFIFVNTDFNAPPDQN